MEERFKTFTVLISKISRNIKKIKNQEMAEYGLRSVHVTCLYYLYFNQPDLSDNRPFFIPNTWSASDKPAHGVPWLQSL